MSFSTSQRPPYSIRNPAYGDGEWERLDDRNAYPPQAHVYRDPRDIELGDIDELKEIRVTRTVTLTDVHGYK
jgi:hypothetical protein